MQRVCPNPPVWDAVFQQLAAFASDNPCVPAQPPLPSILAGWAHTSDVEKISRWAETVAWTNENNCAHLLPDLGDADVNWVEEPMAGAVGPRHEPQAASLSVNVAEPHASDPTVDQAPDDETEGVDAEGVAERCAFCDRRNKPMAGDTCDHFIGMIFDGGMIEPPLCALISAKASSRLRIKGCSAAPVARSIALTRSEWKGWPEN